MKKYLLLHWCGIIPAVSLLLLASCSEKETGENRPHGQLTLQVGISVATYEVYNHVKSADPETFKISVYKESGEEVISFSHASELPETVDLEEGSYYVTAHSDNNLPAAFDNDYYFGKSDIFQITGGQTTSVSVTCLLANIMVTVVYAQTVIDDFASYSTTVSNTGGSLVFGMTETRAGYFNQGPLEIEAVLGYTDGSGTPQTITLTGNITNPEAGRHYEIHVDASLNQGNAMINLNVNDDYETEVISLHEGIGYGDLLITEIMFNPASLGDTEGEWFELFNNSGEEINLNGLVIRRGSNNAMHVIGSDLTIAAGAYAVLGRTAEATDNVDYVYGTSISLGNSGENIIINMWGTDGTDGDVICSVDYGLDGFITSVNGKSLQLNPGITSADEAKLGTNWCASTLAYNTGDLGTPGVANSICE
jgi:hypothetical protein